VTPSNWQVKLIDFGSSFKFTEVYKNFSMATPEYMCPELLTFILKENEMSYNEEILKFLEKGYDKPWVIDIWGLGCVLLEIISGIPLWMSIDTVVETSQGESKIDRGLFAVKGRLFEKIVQKQIAVASNLEEVLKAHNYSGFFVFKDYFRN
jgi:dual specificity tyrosine-phosphorylation-regulated kinase 2/3/4